MTERVLLRLVHISDLHIGRLDDNGTIGPPDALVRRWWGRFPEASGLLGHTFRAMEQLEEFYRDRMAEGETCLIVTGDLTTCGHAWEFATAEQFVYDATVLPHGLRLGLKARHNLIGMIPGNHDHWPGVPSIFGDPTMDRDRVFPHRPILPAVIPLTPDRRLVLFGINSDEEVHPTGPARAFARGKCRFQLDDLDRQIAEVGWQAGDIRVLLMHHSRMHTERRLGFTDSTRHRLNETIESGRLSVLLTGHVHVPAVAISSIAGRSHTWELLEARCGTTLQCDTMPSQWSGLSPQIQLEPNNLLVHDIVDRDRWVEWRTSSYTRTDGAFRKTPLAGSRPVVVG